MSDHEICALCGGVATTREHAPPKAIYDKPQSGRIPLFTFPACSECNNGSSPTDETFKIHLTLALREGTSEAQSLVKSTIRTLQHNQARRRELVSSTRPIMLPNKQGIFDLFYSVAIPPGPMNFVLNKTAKGIFFLKTGLLLDDSYSTQIADPRQWPRTEAEKIYSLLLSCSDSNQLNFNAYGDHYEFSFAYFPVIEERAQNSCMIVVRFYKTLDYLLLITKNGIFDEGGQDSLE